VEEDEDGEGLTPALDAAILSTLGRIRRKEGVYGSENVLAEALKEAEQKAKGLVNVQRKQRGNDKVGDIHRNQGSIYSRL
jgi:protein KRI1